MSSKKPILNIVQASQEIAKFEPVPVETAAGTVTVTKLKWRDFEAVFAEIKDTVIAWLASSKAETMLQLTLGDSWAGYALGGAELPNGAKFGAMTPEQGEAVSANLRLEKGAAVERQQSMWDALIQKISDAPELLEKIVKLSSDATTEQIEACHFDDMLALFATAVRVNFIENQRVQDFFGDVVQAFMPGNSAPENNDPGQSGPAPSTNA